MPDRPMTEAEAIARFSREVDEISARGRAPDCAEQIAENVRECGAMREDRFMRRAKERASNG